MITYLKLTGYKRLHLSGIQDLEWTIQEGVTSIMGRNGCGKSSVLAELSLCPANKKDFLTDGYKEIRATDAHGIEYIAISRLTRSPSYEFYRDGVQLNDSGLVTEQRALVKEWFNYDEYFHSILSTARFRYMGREERRKLLTAVSQLDFSYIKDILPKIQNERRDRVAIVKHLKQKELALVDVIENLKLKLPEDYVVQLERFKEQLQELIQFKTTLKPSREIENELSNLERSLKDSISSVESFLVRGMPNVQVKDINSLRVLEGDLRSLIFSNQNEINEKSQELIELDRVIERLETNGIDKDELLSNLKEMELTLKGMNYQKPRFQQHERLVKESEIFRVQVSRVPDINSEVLEDYFSSKRGDLQLALDNAYAELNNTKVKLGRLDEMLAHLNSHDDNVSCPKCSHSFNPKGSPKMTREEIEANQEKGRLLESTIQGRIEKLRESLEQNTHIAASLREVGLLVASHSFLTEQGLWGEQEMSPAEILTNRHRFESIVGRFIEQVNYDERIYLLAKEVENIQSAISDIEKYGYPKERHRGLRDRIDKLVEENKTLSVRANFRKRQIEEVEKLGVFIETNKRRVERYFELLEELAKSYISEDADREINHINKISGELQYAHEEIDKRGNDLSTLRDELTETQLEEEAYGLLMKHLNFKEGIPAEQLTNFIQNLLETVNRIIREVWTYTLEVNMCRMADDGGLDCLFPVTVKDDVSDDITFVSAGQGDLIDFVFMLAFRECLGLKHVPVFIDELMVHFDSRHQVLIMRLLENLLDTGAANQIIFVTHFSTVQHHIALFDSVVLDGENIVLPKVYNEHVTIKRG